MENRNVSLSDEIHSDWRERIERCAKELDLAVSFLLPVTGHAAAPMAHP